LLEKEKLCADELNKYKTSSLNFESEASDLNSKLTLLSGQLSQLKKDTTNLGVSYRTMYAKYDRLAKINESLETSYNKLLLSGAKESAHLHADLHKKQVELQEKEDALLKLEQELMAKQALLVEREHRVNELEKIINDQEAATRLLKEKVASALKGFTNKGLKVEERSGKIYVSLEAKLLFNSGSTTVESEGREALTELARVLETEKELEIIVEGHTDTDKMAGTKHPKNNWELSVLRSTSVIEIMLDNSNMDPTQLVAAGRSEFIPVDVNNKAKNRRIEIIISPNLNELYKLIGNN
tara:strand:+ start:12761 stop:13651 length:891 start_codon:yes stop_codon:yes gene_type:complete